MEPILDWSAYSSYGMGDAYADIPAGGGDFGKATAVCIGNRQCQRSENGVMCPSFRITQEDRHSTRHRAATLRAALNGEHGDQPFVSRAMAEAMDLCVGCKGCKRECPNGVDMALMRTEALAQQWKTLGGVPLRTRLFASLPRHIDQMRKWRWIMRLRQRLPLLARLGEHMMGIAARRRLPLPATRSFLSTAPAASDTQNEGREVVLLVDTFSNHFDPDIAQAALTVLQAGGYHVHLAQAPNGERPLCCGRTFLSNGMVNEAREEAQRMVDALWPYVEKGLPIVGLEPSCLLMLRDEYYSLGLGDKVASIAKAAVLLEEFLAREADGKRLCLPLQALPSSQIMVHGHCHQKAFGAMKSMRKALGLIPESQVTLIESSCCGMAGSFGMEAEHYEASMKMAESSLLPQIREASPDTLLVANGTSCRHQIKDGAQRHSRHLAQVLRDALINH